MDLLFYEVLLKMNFSPVQLKGTYASITGLFREPIPIEGTIVLLVIVGQALRRFLVRLTFMVIKTPLAYNAILGQLGLNALHAIILTYLLMKFPTA